MEEGMKISTAEECHAATEKLIGSIDPEKISKAVTFLKEKLGPDFLGGLKRRIDKDGCDWPFKPYGGDRHYPGCSFHLFGGGMAVRNMLRSGGFGEEYFGIMNLDDIYTGLLERAVA